MTTRFHGWVAVTVLSVLILALACASLGESVQAVAPPPALPATVTIFDPDPTHLWNRLHRALWVRIGRDGRAYGLDRLDPLLWDQTRYLVEGKEHEAAVAVLDEFLQKHGENLKKDPLRRAILQRDLWALFDWATQPGANTQEAYLRRSPPRRRALQVRLARCIQRLALPRARIEALPENYTEAARTQAGEYDPDHPERPFLPRDLMQPDGPWVEVQADNASRAIASRHVLDFSGRSAFRVFLRFPEGRKSVLDYLARLSRFPNPWVLTREAGRKEDTLVLTSKLPQFPAGTQAALVRQTILIDTEGGLVPTRLTESVQFRVFRKIPEPKPSTDRPPGRAPEQAFYEFTLQRAALFARKSGGLLPVGRDDRDFATGLLVHSFDEFELRDSLKAAQGHTLRRCLSCHDRPGIYSVLSYTGGIYPRGRYDLPALQENHGWDTQGRLSALHQRKRYSWGLLQGLWEERGGTDGR